MRSKKTPRWMSHFFDEDLLVPAFRYYCGRMTIATTCFARTLAKAWPDIPEREASIIKRELEEKFIEDDRLRNDPVTSPHYYPLGQDCDREAWELVRNAYRKRGENK